ncbi:MAG: YicC family protein [Candidatus Chromulinivorax sp.]
MILSMTGFASSTVHIPLFEHDQNIMLTINLKSLNSRFFELSCKMPSLFAHLEVTIQKMLQKKLHRGNVSLHIKISNAELLHESFQPALDTIQNYLDAIGTIRTTFHLQDQVTLAQILQLPNALQSKEAQLHPQTDIMIIESVEKLAEQLINAQRQEGITLAQDIKLQCASMKLKINQIQNLSHFLITEKKELLTKTLHELATFTEPVELKTTEQCLLEAKKTSLMYDIEKVDINEETVRFNLHLENLEGQLISSESVKGKKIDFILQELNREINTIASKCSNIDISTLAIDIKSELEKAREQAQNII